jgi:1-acyl-sn-glycerol-3-phosphate acyltransferase
LSLDLLRAGQLLLVFPEGYPAIDPLGSPRTTSGGFLPFEPGFLALAERAGRAVPVVPVGVWYAPPPGRRLDRLAPLRPAGRGDWLGVGRSSGAAPGG